MQLLKTQKALNPGACFPWILRLLFGTVLPGVLILLPLSAAARPANSWPRTSNEGIRSSASDIHCPALPRAESPIVLVDSEERLWQAVNSALPGTSILVADGTYNLAARGYYLWIDTPGLTLRSQSGNREAVILDDNYQGTETISILSTQVTIADLTIRRARTHAIHIVSSDSGDTLNTLVYNVHVIDPGQQGIKINPHAAQANFPDDGEIACSTIELTDEGRARIWEFNGSCYTGGVDAHQARGWVVRDNYIEGFWCSQGLSEHAIHFWSGSRDTLVERNRLVDNARGIGFGLLQHGNGREYPDNACPSAEGFVDHFGGNARNNFVFAGSDALFASEYGFDCGICLWQACGAHIVHNTVASTKAPYSSIEWRFENSDPKVFNNLASHNLRARDGASATLRGNIEEAALSMLVDPLNADLHLTPAAGLAIDRGVELDAGLCDSDIDGESRPQGAGWDIGADETSRVFVAGHFVYLAVVGTGPGN